MFKNIKIITFAFYSFIISFQANAEMGIISLDNGAAASAVFPCAPNMKKATNQVGEIRALVCDAEVNNNSHCMFMLTVEDMNWHSPKFIDAFHNAVWRLSNS